MRRIREAQRVGESGKRSSRLAREQQKDVGEAGERMVRGFAGSATGGDWGGQRQWNRKSLSLGMEKRGSFFVGLLGSGRDPMGNRYTVRPQSL